MTRKNSLNLPSTRFICDDFTRPLHEELEAIHTDDIFLTKKIKKHSADRQIHLLFEEIEDSLVNIRDLIVRRAELRSSLIWFSFIKKTEKRIDFLFDAAYKAEVTYQHKLTERIKILTHDNKSEGDVCNF
jgi:hypothetical protein